MRTKGTTQKDGESRNDPAQVILLRPIAPIGEPERVRLAPVRLFLVEQVIS